MPGIERRLDLLDAQLPPANGRNGNGHAPEEEPTYWSQREFFDVLRNGFVRFDAPDHVCIHAVGEGSTWYPAVAQARDIINEALQASPGCLLVPLCPDEVELAQRALDAGLLQRVETFYADNIRVAWVDIQAPYSACDRRNSECYIFSGKEGEPFDLHGLAHAVDAAVGCAIIQLEMPNTPPGVSKSLDLVAKMLEWCRAQIDEDNNGDD